MPLTASPASTTRDELAVQPSAPDVHGQGYDPRQGTPTVETCPPMMFPPYLACPLQEAHRTSLHSGQLPFIRILRTVGESEPGGNRRECWV